MSDINIFIFAQESVLKTLSESSKVKVLILIFNMAVSTIIITFLFFSPMKDFSLFAWLLYKYNCLNLAWYCALTVLRELLSHCFYTTHNVFEDTRLCFSEIRFFLS